MASGLLHLHPCPLLLQSQPQSWPLKSPNLLLSLNPSLSYHLLRCFRANSRRWDSNAETVRSRKFGFSFGDGDDYDADDDTTDMDEGYSGFWEEALDSFWIWKVFRSYGWMLPFIILSMLIVNGPKAFLMALAVPLGQSAITLAFRKLWGMTTNNRKRKAKRRKKPFASSSKIKEEERRSWQTRRRRMGYQTRVSGSNGSVNEGSQNASIFGGWDELDGWSELDEEPMQRLGQENGSLQGKSVERSKLSWREESEMPLLLRLLIAVFPFLGSWTKMLW